MKNTSLAQKAGIISMGGSVLFVITVIMQNSLALYGPDSGWLWVTPNYLNSLPLLVS